jgi:hypothetical protein
MSFQQVQGDKGVKLSNKDANAGITLNDSVGSTGGTVSIVAPAFVTFAPGVDVSAAKGATLTSTKGSVTIGTVGVESLTSAITATGFTSVTTLGSIATTTTVALKATDKTLASGFIDIKGPIAVSSTKGSLTLTSGAAGIVSDTGNIDGTAVSAGKITVTAPGGADFEHVKMSTTGSALAIAAAKGNVTIGLNAVLKSFSTVTLTGLGDVTNHGQITGATGVTASSKGADNKTGTLTTDGSITASNSTAKVTLTTTGNLQQNGTILAGSDVTLKASVGSLSTSAPSTTTSSNGKVILTAPVNITDLGSLTAKTNISVTTTAKNLVNTLTVGNLHTTEGNISVIGAGGTVSTTSGAAILADSSSSKTKATLLVEDSNTALGSAINIDGSLKTHGPGGGNVSISIGAPGTGKNPVTSLTGFTIDTSKGGVVFGGTTLGAIQVTGVGTATLTTEGKNIILNSPDLGNVITFTSTSSVTADPPVNAGIPAVAAASIRIQPLEQVAPVSMPSSAPATAINPIAIASAAPDSSAFTAALSNSRTITGGVTFNDELPIPVATGSGSVAPTSGAANYRWVSATELDGGAIPSIFLGRSDIHLTNSEAAASHSKLERSATGEATLFAGTALISPTQDITILTPHGKVMVAARSLAMIMSLPNGLAVYNLHDFKGGSVAVEREGKRTCIAPARAAVFISDKRTSFSEVNPAQLVCYGPLTESTLENGKMFTAAFSLPTAINAMPMLKDLIASKDKQATKIAGDFLKTVAIMQQLAGASQQEYRQHLKPVMTAWK